VVQAALAAPAEPVSLDNLVLGIVLETSHKGGQKLPTIAEKKQREIIATIVGSLRLEGLEVEPQVMADMERIDRGELTTEQAIKSAFDRVTREEIQ